MDWRLDNFDFDDSLNQEIWEKSPDVQESIQSYSTVWRANDIGTQQAMRSPYRLPWVPDVLGRDWRSPEAVLMIGSAYGPFISGNKTEGEMKPSEYDCESCSEFGKRFVRQVMIERAYYTRLGRYVEGILGDCRRVAIFDLCRASFVRITPEGKEKGNDFVVRDAPNLFNKYVEGSVPNDWLWRRISSSEATTIIALGTVAEHGLLRLLYRNMSDILVTDSVRPAIRFTYDRNNVKWSQQYANTERKLKDRKQLKCHWKITGRLYSSQQRWWNVVVAPHPAAYGSRSYAAEIIKHVYTSS